MSNKKLAGGARATASAAALAAVFLAAPAAHALSLTIVPPGVSENSSATANGVLGRNDFYNGTSIPFQVGNLSLALEGAPAALITYTFLFEESSFTNEFRTPAGTLFDPGSIYNSLIVQQNSNGLLNFSFFDSAAVANGSNGLTKPNFGIRLNENLATTLTGNQTLRNNLQTRGLLGQYDAILFWNDGGAGQDVDFDDMVVGLRVQAVPEPGTWAMLAAGLLGLGAIARRRARG